MSEGGHVHTLPRELLQEAPGSSSCVRVVGRSQPLSALQRYRTVDATSPLDCGAVAAAVATAPAVALLQLPRLVRQLRNCQVLSARGQPRNTRLFRVKSRGVISSDLVPLVP